MLDQLSGMAVCLGPFGEDVEKSIYKEKSSTVTLCLIP